MFLQMSRDALALGASSCGRLPASFNGHVRAVRSCPGTGELYAHVWPSARTHESDKSRANAVRVDTDGFRRRSLRPVYCTPQCAFQACGDQAFFHLCDWPSVCIFRQTSLAVVVVLIRASLECFANVWTQTSHRIPRVCVCVSYVRFS